MLADLAPRLGAPGCNCVGGTVSALAQTRARLLVAHWSFGLLGLPLTSRRLREYDGSTAKCVELLIESGTPRTVPGTFPEASLCCHSRAGILASARTTGMPSTSAPSEQQHADSQSGSWAHWAWKLAENGARYAGSPTHRGCFCSHYCSPSQRTLTSLRPPPAGVPIPDEDLPQTVEERVRKRRTLPLLGRGAADTSAPRRARSLKLLTVSSPAALPPPVRRRRGTRWRSASREARARTTTWTRAAAWSSKVRRRDSRLRAVKSCSHVLARRTPPRAPPLLSGRAHCLA